MRRDERVTDDMVEKAAAAYWFEIYGRHRKSAKWPDDVFGRSEELFRAGCRAALSAALEAEQPVAVAVEELSWEEADGGNVCLIATARTPFGSYFIESDVEGFVLTLNHIGLLPHPTFAAAKAAAQQDYETRIRSAIVGVPVTGWQPIETAPKDGTKIIATGKCGVRVVWWGAGAFNRKINAYDRDWTDCVTYGFKLTHWQPLPAAPTTRTADSAEAGGSATLSIGGE